MAAVTKDETYLVVLSGNAGENGNVTLAIEDVKCPSVDVSSVVLPGEFSTEGGPDDHLPCGSTTSPSQAEKTFRYTATEDGLYRVSAKSTDFSPSVTVFTGPVCGGDYLGCNTNVIGATAHPAEVNRFLSAGESITIVVEGQDQDGAFELDVQKVSEGFVVDPCAALPLLGAGSSGTVDGNAGSNHLLSPSCAWAGNSVQSYPEARFQFTVNEPESFSFCYLDIALEGNGTVFILEGNTCAGTETECSTDNPENFTFGESDNGTYTLVIDNADPFGGTLNYQITSTCD